MALLVMQVDSCKQRLASVDDDANAAAVDPNRSPSPPPTYGADGARNNTRVLRMTKQVRRSATGGRPAGRPRRKHTNHNHH